MIERNYDNNLYYVFKDMDSDKFKHLFSSRIGWKDENNTINKIFKSEKDIISLNQIHSNIVHIVDEEFISRDSPYLVEGDGLLTNLNNVILKTYHADCTPLYFTDSQAKIVGVAHAGWKGTFNNILEEMLSKMIDKFSSDLSNIKIYIGPSIKSCCYEVGEDLFRDFKKKFPYINEAFTIRDGRYYLDIQSINLGQAKKLGINSKNIRLASQCTSCNNDKLYSYRKEKGTSGRLITAISLND